MTEIRTGDDIVAILCRSDELVLKTRATEDGTWIFDESRRLFL